MAKKKARKAVKETRAERRARLMKAGLWTDFLKCRAQYVADGLSNAEANRRADAEFQPPQPDVPPEAEEAPAETKEAPETITDKPPKRQEVADRPAGGGMPRNAPPPMRDGLGPPYDALMSRVAPDREVNPVDNIKWVAERIGWTRRMLEEIDEPLSCTAVSLLAWARSSAAARAAFNDKHYSKIIPSRSELSKAAETDASTEEIENLLNAFEEAIAD